MESNPIENETVRVQRIGKKISDILFYGFLVLVLCCILSFIITGKTSGKPNVLGYRHFYIASESMEPTIMTQQLVLTKTIEPDEIHKGDIIAYKNKDMNKIIIHRVIGIKEDEEGNKLFRFKGDNNEEADPYDVTEDMIMYKVIWY